MLIPLISYLFAAFVFFHMMHQNICSTASTTKNTLVLKQHKIVDFHGSGYHLTMSELTVSWCHAFSVCLRPRLLSICSLYWGFLGAPQCQTISSVFRSGVPPGSGALWSDVGGGRLLLQLLQLPHGPQVSCALKFAMVFHTLFIRGWGGKVTCPMLQKSLLYGWINFKTLQRFKNMSSTDGSYRALLIQTLK